VATNKSRTGSNNHFDCEDRLEGGSIATSVEETLMTRPMHEVAITQDSARTLIFEAPVVTLAMKELLVQLEPALME